MGLLDDAIREHLELKRRHGADPEEVSRQEREALGAPAQAEFAQPAAPGAAAPPDAGDEAAAEVDAELREPEPESEPPPLDDDEPAAVAAGEPEEDPWFPDDVQEEEPPPAQEAVPADPEGDDVLEETPEFLQETPEHDRLWFEQKPPRDFDWDK
jgi:hypothetical protein